MIVKITVNNGGLDFDDDVNILDIYTPPFEDKATTLEHLKECDETLREEDEEGECRYSKYGYNYMTLLSEMQQKHYISGYMRIQSLDFTIM